MKKVALFIIVILTVPSCLLAQYGGGNGNGETLKPLTSVQLNGLSLDIYSGGNSRGENITIATNSQLNGDTLSLYGGGNGRGEIFGITTTNQLNGDTLNIFGGGDGRGEVLAIATTNQLNGDTVSIFGGGDGRGENALTLNNNQVNGDTLSIYGGGDGRGEINTTQNTLQLDGVVASIYMGGDGRGETVTQISNIALPITLLSFGASLIDKQVKLVWQTATEINSAYFVVEKSLDGINWKPIGQVKAAGTSSSILNYELFDPNPAEGANFYRLKPTDVDGKFTYSSIATVNFHTAATPTQIMSVFPNPAKYQFTLQLGGATITNKLNIKLLNVGGQIVLQKQNLSGNTQIFDISMLTKGTYFLMVDNNGFISTVKVVKE